MSAKTIAALATWSLFLSIVAAQDTRPGSFGSNNAQTKWPTEWTNEQAVTAIGTTTADLNAVEDRCIKLLSKAKLPELDSDVALFTAIKFLGRIRSKKGVDVLCNWLISYETPPSDGVFPDTERYPALGALVDIGTPSIDGLLNKIATTPTDAAYQSKASDVMLDVLSQNRSLDEFTSPTKELDALINRAMQTASPQEKQRLATYRAKFETDQIRILDPAHAPPLPVEPPVMPPSMRNPATTTHP